MILDLTKCIDEDTLLEIEVQLPIFKKLGKIKNDEIYPFFKCYLYKKPRLVQQGCLQYFANQNCIISITRFALSVCEYSQHSEKSEVACKETAAHYLERVVFMMMHYRYRQKKSFDNLEKTDLWMHACHMTLLLGYKDNLVREEIADYADDIYYSRLKRQA